MHGSRILILSTLLGWCGPAAAAVRQSVGPASEHRLPPAARDSSRPGPVGRGRLPLPREIVLPRLDPEAKRRMRASRGPA